jgi:arylsulfatase A-like enzyme
MDVEEVCPVFDDGSVQTYFLPLRSRPGDVTLENLAVFIGAPGPASLEILSIALVPRGSDYLEDHGVRSVTRDSVTRHTLFAHTPAAFTWRIGVPDGGRLDLALACLPGEAVTYRVSAGPPGGETRVLLEERVEDGGTWRQVSADLAAWAGAEIELALEAESERAGAVALWGAPLVSGSHASERPNVIFYVIDGGGADLMSLYRYNRRTTPFLEELAREGVSFERAYSNSTWTQASTASFMTSLHHSVLGGLRRGIHSTPVPTSAVTMAEHMRRGGYQTAVFTSNPNAGRVIGLERGVDWMEDGETESSTSSAELHEWFWGFREACPGLPYWVHFQTTDVHEPNESVPPYAGLFVTAEDRARLEQWEERLFESAAGAAFGTTSIVDFYDRALAAAGIERSAYFNARRGLYDETMAHQDEQLRRLVERLRARGEWENTLLVIASDHGHPAGTFARFGRGLFEPQPEGWQGALFDSYSTRIPLLFVWPARIAGGRVIREPASMIDVLPTILDLAGLPPPEVAQGRSLAPLLFGEGTPSGTGEVLFDEFRVDEATGELVGNLEIIDGRWGASLEIGPLPEGSDPTKGRHAVPAGGRWGAVHPFFPEAPRLLLYDLWNDPFARRAVNDEHPDLVEHYRRVLLERWQAQLALAQRFGAAESEPLEPEQLEQLRELGYIR